MPEAPLLIEDLVPLPRGQVGLAVLGSPIAHSISPQLHKAALAELCTRFPSFSNWVYHKVEVESKNLGPALERLSECGYRGLNLTIPHKVEVFSLLDTINEEARSIGAVNTLMLNGQEWQGFNSDGYGIESALAGELAVSLESTPVLILGAGGAARAAAAQALSRGCPTIWIGNRSSKRLVELVENLSQSFDVKNVVPFETKTMEALPDGFRLTFTEPVDSATAGDLASYQAKAWTYIYQKKYGSPMVDQVDAKHSQGKIMQS